MINSASAVGYGPAPPLSGGNPGSANMPVSTSRESAAHLTILTDDGDRVTLSYHTTAATTASAGGAGDDTHAGGGFVQHSESQAFSLYVEGDLSAEERKDIQKLLKDVKKIIEKFFRGDLDGAERKADKAVDKLDKRDSLAAFELDVAYLRSTPGSVTGAHLGVSASNALPVPEPVQASNDEPPVTEPVAATAPADSEATSPGASDAVPPAAGQPFSTTTAPAGTAMGEADVAGERALVDALRHSLREAGVRAPRLRRLFHHVVALAIHELKGELGAARDEARLQGLGQRLVEQVRNDAERDIRLQVNVHQETTLRVSVFA